MLYRKYRPQTFDDVVGQETVVRTLKGALALSRPGHAYLFTGPRGTGKTTLARIFAKALNCVEFEKKGATIPCNKCDACLAVNDGRSLDLIEIDAASQTGVDNIRELTDSAMTAASGGGYKVFLIDEVHMLSKSAFNALLKTLEEPPVHVVFILATTEPQKIPPTVLSRVQRFDFKRLTIPEISEKLVTVARAEKMQIEATAIAAIAVAADGALRDAEVMLTKIKTLHPAGAITDTDVAEALGLVPRQYHAELLAALLKKDSSAAIGLIHRIHSAGIDMDYFAKDFLAYTRTVLVSQISPQLVISIHGDTVVQEFTSFRSASPDTLVAIIMAFTTARTQIKSSPIPQLPLELAVLGLAANHEV